MVFINQIGEKRQFFLENNDLFSEFGVRSARPFFSRRIGITYDDYQDKYVETPIMFGARLSSKLNKDWKIGVLDMQTAQEPGSETASTNYAVATVHRRIFERSTLAAFLINKNPVQTFSKEVDSADFNAFNRVGGLDFNLASADNWWTGKVFYHHSFDEVMTDNSYSTGTELKYDNGNLSAEWSHLMVGEGYNAEVGYVRRTGIKTFQPQVGYTFYPKKNELHHQARTPVPGRTVTQRWIRHDGSGNYPAIYSPVSQSEFSIPERQQGISETNRSL